MQLFKNLDKDTRRKAKKLLTNPTAVLGFALLAVYIIVAVLAPVMAPFAILLETTAPAAISAVMRSNSSAAGAASWRKVRPRFIEESPTVKPRAISSKVSALTVDGSTSLVKPTRMLAGAAVSVVFGAGDSDVRFRP